MKEEYITPNLRFIRFGIFDELLTQSYSEPEIGGTILSMTSEEGLW